MNKVEALKNLNKDIDLDDLQKVNYQEDFRLNQI